MLLQPSIDFSYFPKGANNYLLYGHAIELSSNVFFLES